MCRYSNCHMTSTGPVVTSRIYTALPVVNQSASVVTSRLSHKASYCSVAIYNCDATFHHTLSELNCERQSPLNSHDVVYAPSEQAD